MLRRYSLQNISFISFIIQILAKFAKEEGEVSGQPKGEEETKQEPLPKKTAPKETKEEPKPVEKARPAAKEDDKPKGRTKVEAKPEPPKGI